MEKMIAEDIRELVDTLTFAQKVERSLGLIERANQEFGHQMVVANSLGKDSCVTWHLAKRTNPNIRGFIVTTRFKPPETIAFMNRIVAQFPELKVYRNDKSVADRLYESEPDLCCNILKVQPTRQAISEMNVACWVTGLRCTEGHTRTDFKEIERRDKGLVKLNPILLWHEREIWQYLAIYQVPVNPLYAQGYRSLGCLPCSRAVNGANERSGRWVGTNKCGGECGIHTRPMMP
jgi:phosphoadenosine phosphosulfate reductase